MSNSEQFDSRQAQADRTNANWNLGTLGAMAGAVLTMRDTSERNIALSGIYLVGEGGNIAQRVYQVTGDKALGLEVGAARAAIGLAAAWTIAGCVIGGAIGIFGIIGGLMSIGRPESVLAIVGALLVAGCVLGMRWAVSVARENQRIKLTGIPSDRSLIHAGYVSVGDLWVRPEPGQTLADTLRAFGYGAPTIDVRSREG